MMIFPSLPAALPVFSPAVDALPAFLSTASGIFGTSIFISFNTSVSGIISTKEKRLRNAVSRSAIERSAVFIVPMIYTLEGTLNGSPEYGRITLLSSASPFLLDSSISVISSPKIREIFPLLISSIMKTYGFSLSSFAFSQNALNTPASMVYSRLSDFSGFCSSDWFCPSFCSLSSTGRIPSMKSSYP